jgi:hypothetical protein
MMTRHRSSSPRAEARGLAKTDAAPLPVITSMPDGTRRRRKIDLQATWAGLIQGLIKNYAPKDVFMMLHGTLTRDQLTARLQRFIASAEKTKARHSEYLAALEAERRTLAELRSTYDCTVSIVRGRHGKSSERLLEYSIAPAKPRKVSAETKLAAVAKGLATRAARGTMGKRQRAKIRGWTLSWKMAAVQAPAPGPAVGVAGVGTPPPTPPSPATELPPSSVESVAPLLPPPSWSAAPALPAAAPASLAAVRSLQLAMSPSVYIGSALQPAATGLPPATTTAVWVAAAHVPAADATDSTLAAAPERIAVTTALLPWGSIYPPRS